MRIDAAKRISAEILKVGESRVWMDQNSISEILDAATRSDLKVLLRRHVIQEIPKKGNSSYRFRKRLKQISKGRRRGPGSVRGTRNARSDSKTNWVRTIRALRDELVTLKNENRIDAGTYRKYYRITKGGSIRSRSQLRTQIMAAGLLKKGKKDDN